MRTASFSSDLDDKAAAVSNKEHFTIVLRFVDKGLNIREESVDFVECRNGTNEQALATLITSIRIGLKPVYIKDVRRCYVLLTCFAFSYVLTCLFT